MRPYLLPVAILLFVSRALFADVPEAANSDAGTKVVPLDGTWNSAQDYGDVGLTQKWFEATSFPTTAAKPIQVPGSMLEVWRWKGSHDKNIGWYSRTFDGPAALQSHQRYYLRFGGVMDDVCDVWLNGTHLGRHAGNQDPFEYEITSLLQPGKPNTVAVRMPLWLAGPTPLGGIINHVAIVGQPEVRLIDAFAKPDAKAKTVALDVTIENNTASAVPVDVSAALSEFKSGHAVGAPQKQTVTAAPGQTTAHLTLVVARPHLWDLNDPFLYKVAVATSAKAADAAPLKDAESFHTGFRDFRFTNGYFTLNGHRIFLKSLHGNWSDPITIIGTPRDMTYLKKDLPQLKAGGFNTLRFIVSPAYPEQLDQADELGFLIYSEHPTSWLLPDPKRFGESLNQVVRRDRNHPSLVLWGLLNETSNQDIYHRAKNWLPQFRAIDDTRTVILSSGRWDCDYKTGSISNPGSSTWDTYLGGQDPVKPRVQEFMKSAMANTGDVCGDDHMYPMYPLSWDFITNFARVDEGSPRNFFYSESGMGSLEDGIEVKKLLEKYHAPSTCITWDWANGNADGIVKTLATYGFNATYPNPEDVFIDSQLESARQRAMIFSMLRSNPRVIGYNLTSLVDCWGWAEGIFNDFREWKAGHLKTMQEGWAPLRWCLFVNPMNAYSDAPLHIKAALANEDVLAPGAYPATLEIKSADGSRAWKQPATAHFEKDGPFANILFDSDVTLPGLKAGSYSLRASLDGRRNAAAPSFNFTVSDRAALPKLSGAVTALDVPQNVRDFLTKQGAQLHDYAADAQVDREVILVGNDFHGKAADWRALYAKAARGAHLVFLSSHVFHADKARNKWLALAGKGAQRDGPDWLYHKELVAKANDPLFAGLPTKIMDPDFYGQMLANAPFFYDMTNPAPQDTAVVSLFDDYGGGPRFRDGVALASYPFHAGRFTLNTLSILQTIGTPGTDRLLLNIVTAAQKDAAALAPLPADYDAEMDKLGFKD